MPAQCRRLVWDGRSVGTHSLESSPAIRRPKFSNHAHCPLQASGHLHGNAAFGTQPGTRTIRWAKCARRDAARTRSRDGCGTGFMGSRHGQKAAHCDHEPKAEDPKIRGGQRWALESLSAPNLWGLIRRFMERVRGEESKSSSTAHLCATGENSSERRVKSSDNAENRCAAAAPSRATCAKL